MFNNPLKLKNPEAKDVGYIEERPTASAHIIGLISEFRLFAQIKMRFHHRKAFFADNMLNLA